MILNFKKLLIKDFMSFAQAKVDFSDSGFIQVIGENHNKMDMAKSNGSGKSAIWESLVWCLTGSTIRGNKQVVRDGSNDCEVEVEFEADGKNYKIRRACVGVSTKLNFEVDGVDKSGKGIRDTSKNISQHLPDLTAQMIGSVIILGQGLPAKFTANTPSKRKEILESLIKADFMVEDLKNRVSTRQSELKRELRERSDKLIAMTSKMELLKTSLESLSTSLAQLPKREVIQKNIDDTSDTIEVLRAELSALPKDKFDVVHELESDIVRLKGALADELKKNTDSFSEEILSLKAEESTLRYTIEQKKKEISEAESVVDVCPYCGQNIPDAHKIDTAQMEIDLEALQDAHAENKKSYDKVVGYCKDIEEKIKERYDIESASVKEQLETARKEAEDIQRKVDTLNKSIVEQQLKLGQYTSDLERFDTTTEQLKEKEHQLQSYIDNIESDSVYIKSEQDSLQAKLEVENKFSTILSRDFRGALLSNVVSFMNDRAKSYAGYIFENENVAIKIDGNNIDVTYCEKEYESLSGGERQKIDLIVQFSLRDMLVKYQNFASNILVLDEITDNLDYIGCQKILQLITYRLTDVSNVYIISHRQDLDIPFDHILKVVKSCDGISMVEST